MFGHIFMFQTQELNVSRVRPSATFWWQYWSQYSHIDLCYLRNWPRVVTFHWTSHKSYKWISECPEKKMQRGEWLETRSCVWKECSALLQIHQSLSDTSSGNRKLKKIRSIQRSGLSLKIVLFLLLQVMSKIAVARRISIFLTTALLWVAEEQFLCNALQLPCLGLNKLFNYFQFSQ